MSFWDRYLAPGDLRRKTVSSPILPPSPQEQPPIKQDEGPLNQIAPKRIDPAHRARRQNALLYGGLAFTALSILITRRSLHRKKLAAVPKQFTPSNHHIDPPPAAQMEINGALEAAEALGLATMNVFSMAMASTGALMTWFDIADIEDLRGAVRRGAGWDVYGGEGGSQADKEIEGWVAESLALKGGKEGTKGILEGLGERLEKGKEGNEKDR